MPERFWALATVLAFWGWIFSVILFILRSFGGPGEFRNVPALRWGVTWFIFFALWVVAMRMA